MLKNISFYGKLELITPQFWSMFIQLNKKKNGGDEKAAGNAQEGNVMLPSRPVTAAVVCVAVACPYISAEVCIRLWCKVLGCAVPAL